MATIWRKVLQEIQLFISSLYSSQGLELEQFKVTICSPSLKGEVMISGCHELMKHLLNKYSEVAKMSQLLNDSLITFKDIYFLEQVIISPSHILYLQLKKYKLMSQLIKEILQSSDYMLIESWTNLTVLYPCWDSPVTVETGRLLMVTNLLSRMFCVSFHVPNHLKESVPLFYALLSQEERGEMREEKSCRNFEDTLIPLAVESSPSTLRINVQSFLTASFLYGRKKFPQNIKTITVREGGVLTPVGKLAANIDHTLLSQNKDEKILLTTTQRHVHQVLQAMCVLLSVNPKLSLNLLEVGPTVSSSHCNIEEYIKSRYEFTRAACVTKYGPIEQGTELERIALTMGEAAVKFELLSTDPKNILKLVLPDSTNGQLMNNDTYFEGTFVLYNYARIATLERNFKEGVEKGIYPSLPPLNEINFSLLNDQDEWKLLFYYVFQYPSIIRESMEFTGDIKVTSELKKICQFLIKLCHSFSHYYSRVKVLLAPEYRLIPLIHARIAMIMTIKQVLYNGLQLLGITPLEQL